MIPTPGSLWKHFKGTLYRVVAIAKHSETLETLVIYRKDGGTEVWARPLAMWNEIDVDEPFGKRRFTPVD